MRVPAAGEDERRAVFGALDYASGRVVWQTAERKGGDAFAAFLARVAATLGAAWPGEPLVPVMDNVSYHRASPVRAWSAEQAGRAIPFWLPVYAPQLNLIERFWRFLKGKLACHRFWADVDGLAAAATTLPDATEARFHGDTVRPSDWSRTSARPLSGRPRSDRDRRGPLGIGSARRSGRHRAGSSAPRPGSWRSRSRTASS